jgi:CubicO group peptidase (beta-lactamase class C family)
MVDLELEVAARPEHRFRIGSVSKVLTTTAAAKLVSRGLVELDTPIAYWLPDLPQHHRATTLRQLFTHRGGVRHYLPRDLDPRQPGGSVITRPAWTDAEILAAFIEDELVAPVGERVSYSSWGYSLASLVMEVAAGQPFLELIQEEITRPFGLETLMPDQPGAIVPGRVRGYISEEERRRLQAQFPQARFADAVAGWAPALPINPGYCWAGAGFLGSAPDVARFGALHLEGARSAISPAERALLFTPLTEASESSPPLGLGWRVDHDASGRPRWHHAGATPGGRAALVVYPEQGLSIALASNCMVMPGDVLGPAGELADIFAG